MTETQELLKARQLKSILNTISDTSMAFRELNQSLPLNKAKYENKLDQLIEMYEKIVVNLINYLRTTEYGKQNSTT